MQAITTPRDFHEQARTGEQTVSKVQQKDINKAAWDACDTFRGVLDPAQYKDYILVMLFVKYISDIWNDHYETYRKEYRE